MPTDTVRTPALSIVMPTRNQARFIGSAIDSVLGQSGVDLELVVADGASTDGTPECLAALAARYPGRLHWVSEPDGGPADAVNRAIGRTRAPVIGWLNSDDLYTPGAAARALAALTAHPDWVAVYGEGEHVDRDDRPLGRYPTLPPETPLAAWADGCPICQPTMFLRREAVTVLGPLDTGLRTAFDYDYWLRLWKAFPGRVGQVPDVQAHSRLHDEGITLRMRRQVALEGVQVVARHLGSAPAHWLITHVGEALAQHPFPFDLGDPMAAMLALFDEAAPWLAPGSPRTPSALRAAHRGLQMAGRDFAIDLHADGWCAPRTTMRLRQPAVPWRHLRLWGRHAAPHRGPLRLRVQGVDAPGGEWSGGTSTPGTFSVLLPLRAQPGATMTMAVTAEPGFVPAHSGMNPQDNRLVAWRVDAVELLPA